MATMFYFKFRTILKEDFFRIQKEGQPIDLLKRIDYELNVLKLKNNLYAIARYIYIRLGEIFEYNPSLEFASEETRNKLKANRINKRNVTNFQFICDDYAYLFADFLNYYGIDARVVDTKIHVYVLYTINGETFLADLTTGNKDISRIKFGLKPLYNRKIMPTAPKEDHTFDFVDELIFGNENSTEKMLLEKAQELNKNRQLLKWSEEEYIYQTFKQIENWINSKRQGIGFVSGVTHIYDLLQFFIPNYTIYNTHLLDKENTLEMEIFSLMRNSEICYFAFQKTKEENYELHEMIQNELEFCIEEREFSQIKRADCLLLRKNFK